MESFVFATFFRNYDDTIDENDIDSLPLDPSQHEIFLGANSQQHQPIDVSVKKVIQEMSVILSYHVVQSYTFDHLQTIRTDPRFNDVSNQFAARMRYLTELLDKKHTEKYSHKPAVVFD